MFTSEEQPLISGSAQDVAEFSDCDHCMVVDHRSTVEEVVDDAERWLPAELFRHERLEERKLKLVFGNREEVVPLSGKRNDNWLVVYRLSHLLPPDYELFLF